MAGLKVSQLENDLYEAFHNLWPGAFEQAFLTALPVESQTGYDHAKKFGETMDNLISRDLAKNISAAIDYYVKNIVVQGTIITVGNMVTQMAKIAPVNIANPTCGLVPNTLGLGGLYE